MTDRIDSATHQPTERTDHERNHRCYQSAHWFLCRQVRRWRIRRVRATRLARTGTWRFAIRCARLTWIGNAAQRHAAHALRRLHTGHALLGGAGKTDAQSLSINHQSDRISVRLCRLLMSVPNNGINRNHGATICRSCTTCKVSQQTIMREWRHWLGHLLPDNHRLASADLRALVRSRDLAQMNHGGIIGMARSIGIIGRMTGERRPASGDFFKHIGPDCPQIHQAGGRYPAHPPLRYGTLRYLAKPSDCNSPAKAINNCVCIHTGKYRPLYRHCATPYTLSRIACCT